MQKILSVFTVTIILIGLYVINYFNFDACLSDDVEFNCGKHKKRNKRKGVRGFWRKFFFTDVREMVLKRHYVLLIVNFCAFAIMLLLINIYLLSDVSLFRSGFLIFCGFYILSSLPAAFARWGLYKGNVIRSRKKYRKNNRK